MSNGVNGDAQNGPRSRRSGPMKRPRRETIARRQRSRHARSRPTIQRLPATILLNVPFCYGTLVRLLRRRNNLNRQRMVFSRPRWLRRRPKRWHPRAWVIDRRIQRGVNADAAAEGGGVASRRSAHLSVLTNRRQRRRWKAETPCHLRLPTIGSSELSPDSETAEFDSNEE